jgi:hypothetical protein
VVKVVDTPPFNNEGWDDRERRRLPTRRAFDAVLGETVVHAIIDKYKLRWRCGNRASYCPPSFVVGRCEEIRGCVWVAMVYLSERGQAYQSIDVARQPQHGGREVGVGDGSTTTTRG